MKKLREKIAGEIVTSPSPHRTLKKWRKIFDISSTELANFTGKSPSYVSDYESGRRASPGISTLNMFINAFLEIDKQRGYPTAKCFIADNQDDAILAINEFTRSISIEEFFRIINGKILVKPRNTRNIMGYTIVDSLKAILNFSSSDYHQVYGWSTERCLIFTDVSLGRSPMVAIRAHPLTPSAVVYLETSKVDALARKIAMVEDVVLGTSDMKTDEMIRVFNELIRT